MVGFPLLLIPLAICNIIVFLMPGLSFSAPLVTVPLVSGVGWPVTLSDVLVALGILMLLFEVIKGARPGAKYLTDHLLSLIVFGAAAAEFILLPQFGTSTYFLLSLLAGVDFFSGVALRARRPRAAVVAAVPASPPAKTQLRDRDEVLPVPPAEPEPVHPATTTAVTAPVAPTPAIPPAEPVIVAVPERIEPAPHRMEPPPEPDEPSVAHSEIAAEPLREPAEESSQEAGHEPSPEIHSPELQPDGATHPSADSSPR